MAGALNEEERRDPDLPRQLPLPDGASELVGAGEVREIPGDDRFDVG